MTWIDKITVAGALLFFSIVGTVGYSLFFKQPVPTDLAVESDSGANDKSSIASVIRKIGNVAAESSEATVSQINENEIANVQNTDTGQSVLAERGIAEEAAIEERSTNNVVDDLEWRSELESSNSTAASSGSTAHAVGVSGVVSNEPYFQIQTAPQSHQMDENGNLLKSISGRVVDVTDTPVADFTVSARSVSDQQARQLGTRTDQNGRFRFEGLENGEYFLKTQAHPFYSTVTRRLRAGVSGIKFELAIVDVAQIKGRVVDRYDQPIVGATIIPPLPEEEIRTDKDGQFNTQITATTGQGLLLRFTAEEFLQETKYFSANQWTPTEPLEFEVSMRRGSFSVNGLVYDEIGSPVPDALVQITSKDMQFHRSAQTNKDGAFTIAQVLAASDYNVKVTAGIRYQAYDKSNVDLADGMGILQVPLSPSPVGGLKGRILDESGMPVTSLTLMVQSEGAGGRAMTIVSDDEGRYSLEDFVAGKVTLRSRTSPAILVDNLEIEAGMVNEQDLIVDMGNHRMHGMVTNDEGMPVESAKLTMRYQHKDSTGLTTVVKRETVNDIEGAFLFDNLGAGKRTIKIMADGYHVKNVTENPEHFPGPFGWVLER